jgi:transcriptional regulator with XRE-family HTH domain
MRVFQLTGTTESRLEMYGVMDGEKIATMRQERGLSRQELARQAGISMSTLRSLERGHKVRVKTARSVANVFGVHPSEMGHPVEAH